MAAAEDVDVEVGDGFAALFAVVNDEAESIADAGFAGDFAGGEEEMAEEGLVGGLGRADAGKGMFGYDEEVDGGLRIDVVKHDAFVVFVFDFRRDFAVDDFGEESFFAHVGEEDRNLRRTGQVRAEVTRG